MVRQLGERRSQVYASKDTTYFFFCFVLFLLSPCHNITTDFFSCFLFYLFPVQQTTSGIGHRVKWFLKKKKRRDRERGKNHFPSSADHEQDWQPYPVDPYSTIIMTTKQYSSTSIELCMVTHIAKVWINRVRLPILLVVS